MKKLLIILSVSLLALVLAACGGSESEPVADAGPEPVTVDFQFTNEFMFMPDTISAESGAEVTINMDNTESALEHSFMVVPADTDLTMSDAEIEAVAVNGINSGAVAPGETTTYTFTAPDAGEYKFVCAVPGHIAGGMVGDLTVNG
jgi:uncharacterized cupredoxin-like copper-binding protein